MIFHDAATKIGGSNTNYVGIIQSSLLLPISKHYVTGTLVATNSPSYIVTHLKQWGSLMLRWYRLRMHRWTGELCTTIKTTNTFTKWRRWTVHTLSNRQQEDAMLKRSALQYLKIWKDKKIRKPLVIRGARQVGKSYLSAYLPKMHDWISLKSILSSVMIMRIVSPQKIPGRLLRCLN